MRCNSEVWRNWEGNQECVAEVCYAADVDDLKTVIRKATTERKTIRVAGGGGGKPGSASFSVSPVVKNEGGIILKLENLNKGYAHNDNSGRITVQAGMTIAELEDFAAKNHLSFDAMLVPPFVEVGGAVALGCHGSGFNHGTLSDQVVSMDLVTADGSVRTISQETEPHLMRAARVNLGALGVIHTVTFQCVKEFKLHAVDEKVEMKATIDAVKSLVEGHEYVEVFWAPFGKDVLVKKWDKVSWDTPDRNAPTGWDDFVAWSQTQLGTVGLAAVTRFPRCTPAFLHFYMTLQKNQTVIAPTAKIFHYQKYFPRRLWDVAYAFDIGVDFANFQNAWRFVTDKVCEYAKPKSSCTSAWPFSYDSSGIFPQNFLLHARFIKNSDSYLSPTVGFNHTCMLQLITYFGTNCQQYFREIEAHFLSLGARPHWGKTFNTDLDFVKLYGDNMEKFNAVRRQMDPRGLFLNDFTRRAFGLEPS
jgi:UDP-N-acetylenolpyruvoylglucosamine reductase